MTAYAVSAASARPPRAGALSRAPAAARLLGLELRRNVMPWILPPAVALFLFDGYRTAVTMPPFWVLRAMTIQEHALLDFAPFVTGAAAWMGSRDGRRCTAELVGTTAVPRWPRNVATWAATTCWAEVAYLACVAAAYLATARQAAWGGPPWWPIAVGAASVAAFCALGFAAGVRFPSRFTAPLAAVVVLLVLVAALHPPGGSVYALLSPVNSSLGLNLFPDIGVFYSYLPDLAIGEVMFLTGLALAALGALGLPTAAGGRRLRGLAAGLTVAGLAAAGTAVGLAGTARLDVHGMYEIPALHDAASDGPVTYIPVCTRAGIPVCVHPAFRNYLPEVTAALEPVLSQVAGLPGAPERVIQVATPLSLNDAGYPVPGSERVGGRPPVVYLPLGSEVSGAAGSAEVLRSLAAPGIVDSVLGGRGAGSPAQQAVESGLLKAAGLPLLRPSAGPGGNGPAVGVPGPEPGSPAYAAAIRFAALPAEARHAWLVAHLAALRSGQLTPAQIP
jgi:hypothetical protein